MEPLSQTPYVLLLSIPGINVVSAAEFAGEMGPIEHYAKPRAITGRAGLYPSRYQSDEVDHPNGPLVRLANHDLRRAILIIADNLIRCNEHFRGLGRGMAGQERRFPRHPSPGRRPLLPDRLSHGLRSNDLSASRALSTGTTCLQSCSDSLLNMRLPRISFCETSTPRRPSSSLGPARGSAVVGGGTGSGPDEAGIWTESPRRNPPRSLGQTGGEADIIIGVRGS